MGDVDESCVTVCSNKGLVCENAFFTVLNESSVFSR